MMLERMWENPHHSEGRVKSPDQYIGYMYLMSKSVETEPSSFEEEMKQLIWIDAMVEEYDSINKNNV